MDSVANVDNYKLILSYAKTLSIPDLKARLDAIANFHGPLQDFAMKAMQCRLDIEEYNRDRKCYVPSASLPTHIRR